MLVQLVRPLVRSQIQVLANTEAAGTKLVRMVAQWLSYLGVHAEVTHLQTEGDRITVSLRVGKPEQCHEDEWQQILSNLTHGSAAAGAQSILTYATMSSEQRSKVHRLLAYVLRVSMEDPIDRWEDLHPQLTAIGLEASMLPEIRSAMRVEIPIELLVKDLDPEVAAYALSKAISIALLDKQINQAEDDALNALLHALEREAKV